MWDQCLLTYAGNIESCAVSNEETYNASPLQMFKMQACFAHIASDCMSTCQSNVQAPPTKYTNAKEIKQKLQSVLKTEV